MEYTKSSCLLLATYARIIKIPILKFQSRSFGTNIYISTSEDYSDYWIWQASRSVETKRRSRCFGTDKKLKLFDPL
jgi:hypothetical protein